jgi:hypothetical protein
VLLVLAAPIGEDTQTYYNFKNFANFLNVFSANILVLTSLQHQYIGAVQGESKCLQHHTYSVKHCLLEIELFQDGGQIKTKRTSITTMGAKIQAFDIFQTPLSSHYPLPLKENDSIYKL